MDEYGNDPRGKSYQKGGFITFLIRFFLKDCRNCSIILSMIEYDEQDNEESYIRQESLGILLLFLLSCPADIQCEI